MLGEIVAAGTQMLGGFIQNVASAKQAQANREWQEGMSATSHQREVADLRAAGLNPILSASHGGAATPGGAVAAQGNPMAGVVSSALEARRNRAEVDKIIQDEKTSEAAMWDFKAGANLKSVDYNVRLQDEKLRLQQLQTERERTREASATADMATSNAKGRKLEGQIDETRYGEVMRYIDRAIKSLTGGASAYGNVKP